jgi:mannosyltransferase OCH1-like enzyme
MIPKRIFYVWGVNDVKKRDVNVCIQTWHQVMPDYEIIEINEDSNKYFYFQKELCDNKWFRAVYQRGMWAYVADYVRIKTLYEHGGVYFDTDVSAVRTLDKFLNDPLFVGMQNTNLVEPAVLGAKKGNPFLGEILSFYDKRIWEEPVYTMPSIFAEFLRAKYELSEFPEKNEQEIIHKEDIFIYPERYFIPFRYGSTFIPECVKEDTHTIHWFGASWIKPEIWSWLDNKHRPYFIKNSDSHNHINPIVEEILRIKLFNVIPLMKIRITGNIRRYYLFDCIRIAKSTSERGVNLS